MGEPYGAIERKASEQSSIFDLGGIVIIALIEELAIALLAGMILWKVWGWYDKYQKRHPENESKDDWMERKFKEK